MYPVDCCPLLFDLIQLSEYAAHKYLQWAVPSTRESWWNIIKCLTATPEAPTFSTCNEENHEKSKLSTRTE